jgi:hypothetical protein
MRVNRFDLAYWEGAREAALAMYEYLRDRCDVPEDIRAYAARILAESAERKNKAFREELRLPVAPSGAERPCRPHPASDEA